MRNKFMLLSVILCAFFIVGCVSSPKTQKEVVFEEVGVYEIYSASTIDTAASKGYSGIILRNTTIRSESDKIIVAGRIIVKADTYTLNNPDFIERIEEGRKYNIYLIIETQGDFWNGYSYVPILARIDGLRTVVEISAEKEEEQIKRSVEEKKRSEKRSFLDQKAKKLTDGFIYHGIEEASANAKLFESGALESDHAYYISAYMVYVNGTMGGAVVNQFSDMKYHYVDYASQKIKGEVVGAGQTVLGTFPVTVVIAGGKAPMYTPIILGLVE